MTSALSDDSEWREKEYHIKKEDDLAKIKKLTELKDE